MQSRGAVKRSLIFIAGVILYCNTCAFCSETTQVPPGKAEGSIYAYSDNDIPEVFFFPREQARWDGTRVTMSEWYMLTDLQKEKFVSEYIGELKRQYQGAMEATGLDYLKALNLFSYYADEKSRTTPSTKFIDLLLEGQNKGKGE